jgi:hypothetical protein
MYLLLIASIFAFILACVHGGGPPRLGMSDGGGW